MWVYGTRWGHGCDCMVLYFRQSNQSGVVGRVHHFLLGCGVSSLGVMRLKCLLNRACITSGLVNGSIVPLNYLAFSIRPERKFLFVR